jgi:DNA polymerase V
MPSKVYALVDCNNFYVSCERLFNPRLNGKPVIVLSNNDGCAVARSNEAKALGIPMGAPLFKIKDMVEQHGVQVFSSNYTLYGDLSQRVMETLAQFTPEMEVYSIDEAFLELSGMPSSDLATYGRQIRSVVKQWTGIPVSIGMGSTKTLAKLANRLAKKSATAQGVLDLTNSQHLEEALQRTPVEDIWNIGYRSAQFLKKYGITSALHLKDSNDRWIRQQLKVTGQRTVWELRGICCYPLVTKTLPKKSTCVSRSFGRPINELCELREAVATYTSRAAEKLRRQHLATEKITVFLQTNRFREDLPQHYGSLTLPLAVATNSTLELLPLALLLINSLYREGHHYKKAGVILAPLVPADTLQMNLFYQPPQARDDRLMETLDSINREYGSGTLHLGATGLDPTWQMKAGNRSPRYTTCWEEIPQV